VAHSLCVGAQGARSGSDTNPVNFLAGDAPAYVDYVVFSVFQWARIGSPRDVLAEPTRAPVAEMTAPGMNATRAWRSRMVALHDGLGDRFPAYPTDPDLPDGRAT
jgi:hypothetical protein